MGVRSHDPAGMIKRLLRSTLIRFGVVSVAGLAVDLTAAWSLAAFAALPLPLAGFIGFCLGALVNYLLHERWTFGTRDASARNATLYGLALGVTLATRVGMIAAFEAILPSPSRLLVLVLATGVSFIVNYLLSRFLVFQPPAQKETRPR